MHVFQLTDERGNLFASHIYGGIHIDIANRVFEGGTFEEKDFPDLFQRYLREVRNKISQDRSREIWQSIQNLNFEKLDTFKLIMDLPNYVDVFVEIDEKASRIWERYEREVVEEKDLRIKKMNYLKIRRAFREYVVSVPIKSVKGFIEDTKGNMVRLRRERVNDYYNEETGMKRDESSWIML